MSADDLIKEKERLAKLRQAAGEGNPSAGADQSCATGGASAPDLDPKYRVEHLLGQGGMGAVYKVFDRELGKTFAIKILRKELAEDAQAVRRFELEIKAASDLTHENLVPVYGHGRTPGNLPYLVMDYVDGQSLADLLAGQRKISKERALSIFTQVCQALEHAHKNKVIHRDLKPSNIMLKKSASGADDVRVLDFGIAKILPSEGSDVNRTNLTQTGDVFGSPIYMSPEQCENNPQDARSDIYALGCVMYEALTGVQPFYAENPVKVILKHINLDPAPMSSVSGAQGISRDFDSVVQKCLERNPKDRYQSVDKLLEDLKRIAEGKPVSAKLRKVKKTRPPFSFKKKMLIATAVSLVTGVSLAAIFEGVKLYNVLNNSGPIDYNDPIALDNRSYLYFIKGDYAHAAPLLEFSIATYRERIEADRKTNNREKLIRDETLLTENIQHVGKCYLELAKRAESAGKVREANEYWEKALERYEEAMKFWRRYTNLSGTMAPEAVSDLSEILQKLGYQKRLNDLNQWRKKVGI